MAYGKKTKTKKVKSAKSMVKKAVPKGMHRMPNGKLMRGSKHKK